MLDEPISPLRQRMIDDMTARRFNEHTQMDYFRSVRSLAAFLGRSPDAATSEDVRRYQLQMAKEQILLASVTAACSALRFFFKVTLERPDLVRHLTPVRHLRKAPVVQARTKSRASSKPRPADGLRNVTEGPFWLLTVGQFRGRSGAIDSTADGATRLAESSL